MNINTIDKDTVSVDGDISKRVEEEILICTLDGYQYFLGPEYDDELGWDDAKKWCESLGEGYELPNRLVMLAICMNEDTATLLTEYESYWTSTDIEDDASYAWTQNWLSSVPGGQHRVSKSKARRVRAVRRRGITKGNKMMQPA